MEHISNEEKARILSNKGCLDAYINKDAESLNPTEEDRKRLSIYGASLEAMQWKEQQMIDKAVEWIKDNINSYLDCYDWGKCRVGKDELIDDFRKAMKGE